MNNYKKRLKLRHYAKSGVDLTSKNRKKFSFYNPSFIYAKLSSNLKLEDYFKKLLLNHRKVNSYFGFHKTSLLKKIIKKKFLKKTKYKYLKEIELCSILERRLDLILLRVGFVSNLFEAKAAAYLRPLECIASSIKLSDSEPFRLVSRVSFFH